MRVLQLDNPILGSHSSGEQYKYWIDRDHLLKLDTKHKESSKEVSAYKLGTALGLSCAPYEAVSVSTTAGVRKGCISLSFLKQGDTEIPVAEILEAVGVTFVVGDSAITNINKTISAIVSFTGMQLKCVQQWVYDMLVFDFIICNSDRHLNNFEVLYNAYTNSYFLAPYFDHGASFLDTDKALTIAEYNKRVRSLKSKPFSNNPSNNLGDKRIAKTSFMRMLKHVGNTTGIRALGISDSYTSTVVRRIEELNRIFNG